MPETMSTEEVEINTNSTEQVPIMATASLSIENTTLASVYTTDGWRLSRNSQEMTTLGLDPTVQEAISTETYLGTTLAFKSSGQDDISTETYLDNTPAFDSTVKDAIATETYVDNTSAFDSTARDIISTEAYLDNSIAFESTVNDASSTWTYFDNLGTSVSPVENFGRGNFSPESYLEQLNGEFADSISPAIVFVVVLMLVGLIGNVYVLYVYSKNNCNRTIIRFIQALAVFDLLSCAIAMPGEILDMTQNYTFGSSALCPTFRTVNLFCTMASGATLVVVAIDRYQRICYPLKSQIKPRTAGLILMALSLVCVVMSSPSAVVFGSKTVATPLPDLNGTDCSISDHVAETALPLAFNGFQLLLFLIGAVALVIIYTLIARTILHQARQRKRRNRQRRRSLKNGGVPAPAYNRPEVSSPSSPTNNPKRPFFRYPDAAVLDNVLDLSDVMPSMKAPPDTDKGDAHAEIRYSNEAEDAMVKSKLGVRDSARTNHAKNSAFPFTRSISVTSSTSGIDTDIPSNSTLSPPDTPVDVQRLECVSLLKHKASPNARLLSQLKRHSADRIMCHQSKIQECSDSTPAVNGSVRTDQNANKQTIGNANLTPEQVSDENGESFSKPEIDHVTPNDATSIGTKAEVEKNSEKQTDNGDAFHRSQIVMRERKDPEETAEDLEGKSGRLQANRISLLLPPPKRKVVFRSSSLGHEDTKGHTRPLDKSNSPRSSPFESDIPDTPLRRRRLSSFRGLKDLKRLTSSEYQGTVRTTSMLFLITLIYILSFLPHLVLMTFKAIGDENNTWLVARNIIVRSYFINSVANPIIYSFCSRNFFSQCRNPSGHTGTLTR